MLRRLISVLTTALPSKTEHMIPCPATPYQAALLAVLRDSAAGGEGAPARVRGVNNVLMEMRKVCNCPLISALHAPGADAVLADQCTPTSVQLGGKMAMLAAILQRVLPAGARTRKRYWMPGYTSACVHRQSAWGHSINCLTACCVAGDLLEPRVRSRFVQGSGNT